MRLIRWNDTLCLNITEIDQQHRKLVDVINELNEAMRQSKGKALLGKILAGLVAYAGTHFRTEERILDRLGYPETARHKAEHAAFVKKVAEFRQGFESGKLGLSLQVMTFLSDWLQHPIKGTDKTYVPFLQQNGVR
jgi:hemerythrin